jgi:predicted unusual protein kinase regulating ubiquinone biosynthesis (AarF/ABC1/UbiB family)
VCLTDRRRSQRDDLEAREHAREAAGDYDIVGLVDEFAQTLRAEMDYCARGAARSASR